MSHLNSYNIIHKLSIVFTIYSLSAFSQSREDLISKLIDHPRYQAEILAGDIIELKDRFSGQILYKDISINEMPNNFNADLIIDLRTIDTSKYSSIYSFWSEIPVGSALPLRIADANFDGRLELYGAYESYQTFDPEYVIFEVDSIGNYDSLYNYPDSLGWVYTITDLENDGFLETANLVYTTELGWHIMILTTDSITGYPTTTKTTYNFTPSVNGQPNRINFYDMDDDNYPEMIYYFDGTGDSLILDNSNHISKYNRDNDEFELVYQNRPPTLFAMGYAFGDFDSDGKQNFSVGSIYGEVFLYEHVEGNDYNLIKIDSLPINNAYLSTFTNDLNNNGKPELWIGGWGYINGVGSVILYIYEADDNDQYSVVYTIALIGGISFFAGNMFPIDLDNNGKDEVLICIDQNVLALKYNNDNYELYYIKRNELLHQNSIYYSATVDDFDADGYPEVVISMDQIENNLFRIFCRILKKSNTVDIADAISSESSQYNLSDSYPNPFNPSTTLRFKIPIEDRVTIKVFNILGKEIKTLLDETRQSGEHLITWDGNDSDGNKMPSGIYFITMLAASELTGETRSFQKTIKAILIK
jgi:hypothetical protein